MFLILKTEFWKYKNQWLSVSRLKNNKSVKWGYALFII